MNLLRKHATDAKKFGDYLKVLDKVAFNKIPLQPMNLVIEPTVLAKCVTEIRQSCDFPIRPEAVVRSTRTTFQENLAKWVSPEQREPDVVDFVLLYMRGKNNIFTIAKVWSESLD